VLGSQCTPEKPELHVQMQVDRTCTTVPCPLQSLAASHRLDGADVEAVVVGRDVEVEVDEEVTGTTGLCEEVVVVVVVVEVVLAMEEVEVVGLVVEEVEDEVDDDVEDAKELVSMGCPSSVSTSPSPWPSLSMPRNI